MDEYDELEKMIEKKSAEIKEQMGDTNDGAINTKQIEDKITEKLDEVESYTRQ